MDHGPSSTPAAGLRPYLPRLVRAWSLDPDAPRHRTVDGSIVSVDISGFTALAERLQAKGKAGAEELVSRISAVFDELIGEAERHGGDVLKFRGDALLLLFDGPRHAERACGAGSDMQWAIERVGTQETTLGTVELRMSVGVHTAPVVFCLTEEPHRELLVVGPAATRVFELEDLASAGEIVVSAETAAAVDPAWLDRELEGGILLRRLPEGAVSIGAPPDPGGTKLEAYVPSPLRAHLAVTSGEAEHRQVTVAFLKLSGTDALLAGGGPQALLATIDRLAGAVAPACATYGLTWLESDIDVDAVKLYLTAGAPSTTGADEEAMLRALKAIVGADVGLPLRAGVNRGHAFTGDIGAATRRTYAVMGDTVNLAARLCGKATAGEVLTTGDVLERANTVWTTASRSLELKGKALPVVAHGVGEPIGTRDSTADLDGQALIGRDEELALLRQALDEASAGRVRVAEVAGEPGMGKSRLVHELLSIAGELPQLATAAEQYAASNAYFALRGLLRRAFGIPQDADGPVAGEHLAELLDRIAPELRPWLPLLAIPCGADAPSTPQVEALDAAASRDRLHLTVRLVLERVLDRPTILLVEDAHWLDDASRFLLHDLLAHARAPWLVLVTTRPTDLSLVTPGRGTRIELGALDPDIARSLVLAVADELALSRNTVEALVERAGGNPLFVRELVFAARHGQSLESLPDSIESLLTARIDTLAPTDRVLLRYAAVVGPSFDLALAADILRDEVADAIHPERWAALGEFLVPASDGELAFRHDLVRSTAYEGLSFRRRREIHGRVGTALERRFGARATDEAALLSLHFAYAEEWERTWRYATTAGRHAMAGFANVIAADQYARALDAAAHLAVPAAEVATVAEALGDACERFGAYDRARAAYGRVRELVPADAAVNLRLVSKEGVLYERQGRIDLAIATYEEALGRQGADDPEATRTRLQVELGLAGALHRSGASEHGLEIARGAAERAEAAGARERLAHAYHLIAAIHGDMGDGEGPRYTALAIPIYRELGDHRGLYGAYNNLGIALYYAGRWDEAAEAYREGRTAADRAGDVIGEATVANNIAEILSDQGALDEADELFRHMLRTCRSVGYAIGEAVAVNNLARASARAGRFDEARAAYDEAIEAFRRIGSRGWTLEARARLGECHVLAGCHAEAIPLLEGVLADDALMAPSRALALRALGLALHQAQRAEEGTARLCESLAAAEELGAEYEVALTLHALAAAGAAPDGRTGAETFARLGVLSVPSAPLP